MKRHTSRNSHRDEKPRASRNEDSDAVLRARTEEEKRRRRREWLIEQDKLNRHNRLKAKMAMDYEIRRARNMGLPLPEGRCDRLRRSRSESPLSLHRRTSAHQTPEHTVLSKKFGASSGTMPLFKGPEGTKISSTELRKVKVNIRRNISGRAATHELKRDVPNKEEVVLKRRAGEGSKPIFDREEIKRAISETDEVQERRTVVSVNLENSENKSRVSRRHSASLSPTRTRRHSPRSTSSRHPRNDDSKYEHKGSYRSDREKDHSRERKDGHRSYRDHRERSRGRSGDRRKTDRSKELSQERGELDRPREQRVPPERYIEPIPVPIYYGNFQPRPLIVEPWMPIRGPLGGNIHPPLMRPLRTFPPRSMGIPPDLYGFHLYINPREGSKPIFDREEIKRAISETDEVGERHIVVTVNLENSENKSKTLQWHSASLSATRTRSHSPRRTSSRHPRYDDSKHEHKGSYRSDSEKDHSRERKDGERSYGDHQERPRHHSRDRRNTDRSKERDRRREQGVSPEPYMEPTPVPIYYANFQPRPLMVGPWIPIRGPLGGNIHPPMMRPLRTFPPRAIGISPDMYRFRPPLNPRFSQRF